MIKRIKRLIDRIRTKKIEINTRYVVRDGWKVEQYGGYVYLNKDDLNAERLEAIKERMIREAQRKAAEIVKDNVEIIAKTTHLTIPSDPLHYDEYGQSCAGTCGWKMSFIVRDENARLKDCEK